MTVIIRIARGVITATLGGLVASCTVAQDPNDFPYSSGTILRHESGALRRGRLVEPTELQGLPCASWVWWREDGKLDSAELARDFSFQGHAFPKGTRLFLDRDGRLLHAWLARDTVVDGRLCRGGGKIDVSFHPNGRVKEFFPPEDLVIDEIPCEASVFHPVALFPDGHLRRCKLAADCRIDGRNFEKGSLLEFDEFGRPGS